jgi:hypothetical protein
MLILFNVQHLAFGYHRGSLESGVEHASGARRLIVLLAAGAFGGIAWFLLRRDRHGGGPLRRRLLDLLRATARPRRAGAAGLSSYRGAAWYGRGWRVSHCQNVRRGGRALISPLLTCPVTSMRSVTGTS